MVVSTYDTFSGDATPYTGIFTGENNLYMVILPCKIPWFNQHSNPRPQVLKTEVLTTGLTSQTMEFYTVKLPYKGY